MVVAGSSHVLTSLHLFISFFSLRTSQTFIGKCIETRLEAFKYNYEQKFIHRFSYAGGLNCPLVAWDSLQNFPAKKLFLEVRDVAQEHLHITCSPVECIPSKVSHSLTIFSSFLLEHRSFTCARYLILICGADCNLHEVYGSFLLQLNSPFLRNVYSAPFEVNPRIDNFCNFLFYIARMGSWYCLILQLY